MSIISKTIAAIKRWGKKINLIKQKSFWRCFNIIPFSKRFHFCETRQFILGHNSLYYNFIIDKLKMYFDTWLIVRGIIEPFFFNNLTRWMTTWTIAIKPVFMTIFIKAPWTGTGFFAPIPLRNSEYSQTWANDFDFV